MLKFGASLAHCFLQKIVPAYRFLRIQTHTRDRQHAHRTPLNRASITVLNWNIAKQNHHAHWLREFHTILHHYQPDLILLQEVRMGREADHAVDLVDMSWTYAPNFMDAHHQAYSGVLTAAKTNSIHSQAIVTEHYEPIVQTPKVSLVTEYPLSDSSETLLAINSHLINFVDLKTFHSQLQDLEIVLATHPGPIVFAGDFNLWSTARSQLLDQAAARLSLFPVTFSPRDRQNIKRFLWSPPLDYIFYRGLVAKPMRASVLNWTTSSDHKPLLAEFALSELQ
uniref:Endonuclease/exonuclease/phosphatase family protein n=1 Tax=Oscillatoriales cyanobacterium SpSt-402 TaxID=2282168 RepID=A0A832H9H9_9CYAN